MAKAVKNKPPNSLVLDGYMSFRRNQFDRKTFEKMLVDQMVFDEKSRSCQNAKKQINQKEKKMLNVFSKKMARSDI